MSSVVPFHRKNQAFLGCIVSEDMERDVGKQGSSPPENYPPHLEIGMAERA